MALRDLRIDWYSVIPSKAEWVLIALFMVGALALIPQYVTVTTAEAGWLLLGAALLTLALKIFTTQPVPTSK